jgi:hypothetical protein
MGFVTIISTCIKTSNHQGNPHCEPLKKVMIVIQLLAFTHLLACLYTIHNGHHHIKNDQSLAFLLAFLIASSPFSTVCR